MNTTEKPVLTDEEIFRVAVDLLKYASDPYAFAREIERLTRERMADRIERLEAVRDAAADLIDECEDVLDSYMVHGKAAGSCAETIQRKVQAYKAALAAERREEKR